jgi:hypothetical protein
MGNDKMFIGALVPDDNVRLIEKCGRDLFNALKA